MTLRGVGPYFYGSRLDIKPLTILCGANGSGKSTWLNILHRMRTSLDDDRFPYYFCNKDGDWYEYLEKTNACYYCAQPEHYQVLSDQSDGEFGPPGTIGVEIIANRDFQLGDRSDNAKQGATPEQAFLWHGIVKAGARFTISIAHPASGPEQCGDPMPERIALTELRFNDSSIIRNKTVSDDMVSDDTPSWNAHLSCSSDFIAGVTWATDAPVEIVEFTISPNRGWSSPHPDVNDREAETLEKHLLERIRQLLRVALDGCFHVGAIRRIDYSKLDDRDPTTEADHDGTRYVGFEGELAWLVEREFAAQKMCGPALVQTSSDPASKQQYKLQNYVSTWMNYLTGTEIVLGGYSEVRCPEEHVSESLDLDDDQLHNLTGLLEHPVDPQAGDIYDSGNVPSPNVCLSHPCFGKGLLGQVQPPSRFSAGFHQLFPIIVQLGVMRSGELFCLENPEAHLHPSLQIQLTECLIAHLASGRRMIIETHSDLVVRRILRAVLSEEVAQSDVQIYFTQIEPLGESLGKVLKTDYHSSVLRTIRIDDQGRVENWPKGFMDDDLRESQRLLDIMYGRPSSEDENE